MDVGVCGFHGSRFWAWLSRLVWAGLGGRLPCSGGSEDGRGTAVSGVRGKALTGPRAKARGRLFFFLSSFRIIGA